MINIILYPISILPVVLIYCWIKKSVYKDDAHRNLARESLISGFKAVIPVIIICLVLQIIEMVVFKENSIIREFYHAFFLLAFSEELSKAYMLEKLLKKQAGSHSWLDIIIYMVIIAIGFDILESAVYAIGTNPVEILVRGVTCPHLGYGFIMGYFIGKAKKEGNRLHFIPAFLIPWIMHGSYDFCVGFETGSANDAIVLTALAIAAACLVLTILFVVFVIKAKNKQKYTDVIVLPE